MGRDIFICVALLLAIFVRHIHADDSKEAPNVTGKVPCNETSGLSNCTGDGEQGTISTTEYISTTNSFSLPPLHTVYPDDNWYDEGQDWDEINSTDVDMYLDRPDVQEYIASFRDEFQRMLIKETLRVCPYATLCNITFGLQPPPYFMWLDTGKPCCSPCSCRADCVSDGTCCPDYPSLQLDPVQRSPSPGAVETCMEAFLLHSATAQSVTDDIVKAYTNCPQNADEDLNFRCSGSFDLLSNITFDDVIPMSDNSTMKTYRNRHCAECNGLDVTSLIQWDVRMVCLVAPEFSSPEELLSGIMNGSTTCDLHFSQPSTDLDVEYCNQMITTCNETGLWAEFDPDINRACAVYESAIDVVRQFQTVLFRNPFCAICNGQDPYEYLCKSGQGTPSNPYTFSGLLRLDTSNSADTSTNMACEPGHLFNDIKSRCQAVTCSAIHTLRYDHCEPFFGTSDSIGVRVFFLVRPSVTISIEDVYYTMPIIRGQFEQLMIKNDGWSICKSQAMVVLENGSTAGDAGAKVDIIEFTYDIIPYGAVDTDEIVGDVLSFDRTNVTIETSPGNLLLFRFYLKDDTRDYERRIQYGLFENWTLAGLPLALPDLLNMSIIQNDRLVIPYFNWNESPGICYFDGTILRLLALKPCPMFSINKTEFGLIETSYGLKFKTGGDILVGLLDYVIADKDPFVRMCVDTYKRVFKDYITYGVIHEVGSVYSAELIVSIVSVSVSIVCLVISLFAYCYLPQIQTLPGKNNMALIVSLLLAQCMYILSSYGQFDTDSFSCKLVGGLTHFFWLLSIFWMNVCTFHMFRVLVRTRNVSGKASTNKHLLYHAYVIVISLVFVAVNVIVSMVTSDSSDIGYGGSRCYVSTQRMLEITFGIPAAIVVIANMSMFLTIIVKLKRAPTVNKNVKHERNYVIVFAKLSTITGATWVFGFVYMWTGIVAFSYIFTILNGSQGLFLMVSFVCNTRTVGMVKDRSKALTSSFTRTHSTNTRLGSVHSGTKKTDDTVVK